MMSYSNKYDPTIYIFQLFFSFLKCNLLDKKLHFYELYAFFYVLNNNLFNLII
jgi:hypothetical protein